MADERVLLIEDNHEHATLIQALLDYRSLMDSVFVAASVAEAMDYMSGEFPFHSRLRDPLPALIVLDHWLPDGTGLEILEWLHEQDYMSSIPVVVFTACRDPKVERRARQLGARDFLVKPDDYEELAAAIDRGLRPGTDYWSEESGSSKVG